MGGFWVQEEGAEIAAEVWGLSVMEFDLVGRGMVLFATVWTKLARMKDR